MISSEQVNFLSSQACAEMIQFHHAISMTQRNIPDTNKADKPCDAIYEM